MHDVKSLSKVQGTALDAPGAGAQAIICHTRVGFAMSRMMLVLPPSTDMIYERNSSEQAVGANCVSTSVK